MSEVKRYALYASHVSGGTTLVEFTQDLRNSFPDVKGYVHEADFDRVTAENSALQALLTAADEENDALKGLAVKQAALLDELGIPLDEVDDLFGETLKNAKRYEYVRSVMAVENFPAPHPAWSEPSEVESKRIDDLCDAALKPAEDHPCPVSLDGCDGSRAQ